MELANLNVLVVEDNVPAAHMLRQFLLESGGRHIAVKHDGREAQEFLDSKAELIDLIICDWRMPRMTGLELLQQVRTVYPDMPFMMITANADTDSVKAARQFGVTAYIAKPYTIEQLQSKLGVLAMQM
jgi:two-component system chemotaxis response regulator CheY